MGKRIMTNAFVCLVSLCFLFFCIRPTLAQEVNRVRAKIGIRIKTGDRVLQAKAMEELKAGDLIRIYVHPELSSWVYVVHTDQKKVTLLNMSHQKIHSSTLVLPSVQETYAVDGMSPEEAFTIICSPREIMELTALSGADMPYERWLALERDLMDRSKIEMGQQTERPFPIIGNVRGDVLSEGDPFLVEIPIFSGRDVLVKKYKFRIRN